MHLDLERCSQAVGDKVDRVLLHQFAELHPLGHVRTKQPGDIVATLGTDALIVEGGGALADLLNLWATKVVTQRGVAYKQHASLGDDLHQALKTGERFVVRQIGSTP